MIVAKSVAPVRGNPFFSNEQGGGMDGLLQEADAAVLALLAQEVSDLTREPGARQRAGSVASASL